MTRAQEPHQARYTASCCVCGTRSEHGDAAPGGRGVRLASRSPTLHEFCHFKTRDVAVSVRRASDVGWSRLSFRSVMARVVCRRSYVPFGSCTAASSACAVHAVRGDGSWCRGPVSGLGPGLPSTSARLIIQVCTYKSAARSLHVSTTTRQEGEHTARDRGEAPNREDCGSLGAASARRREGRRSLLHDADRRHTRLGDPSPNVLNRPSDSTQDGRRPLRPARHTATLTHTAQISRPHHPARRNRPNKEQPRCI